MQKPDAHVASTNDVGTASEAKPSSHQLLDWLKDREANARRLADFKQGADRVGWLEDAAYFSAAARRIDKLLNAQPEPLGDGGPAFSRSYTADGHNGMSLRDYFAAKALMTLINREYTLKETAVEAYLYADEMLRARAA